MWSRSTPELLSQNPHSLSPPGDSRVPGGAQWVQGDDRVLVPLEGGVDSAWRRTGSTSRMPAMACSLSRMLDSQLSSVCENSLS